MRDKVLWPLEIQPPTFEEKFRQGKSIDDGLEGSMPLREEWEKPWSTKTHKPTRGSNENY
jgi:hypothetical protein